MLSFGRVIIIWPKEKNGTGIYYAYPKDIS